MRALATISSNNKINTLNWIEPSELLESQCFSIVVQRSVLNSALKFGSMLLAS